LHVGLKPALVEARGARLQGDGALQGLIIAGRTRMGRGREDGPDDGPEHGAPMDGNEESQLETGVP
jgi:hypothetical protein